MAVLIAEAGMSPMEFLETHDERHRDVMQAIANVRREQWETDLNNLAVQIINGVAKLAGAS